MKALALALVLWLLPASVEAVCTAPCVQFKNGEGDVGSPDTTITLDSPTTTGNLLVVFASCYYDGASCHTPWSVTDNKSNTFASFASDGSGSFGRVEVLYAYNITGGSGHDVTFSLTTTPSHVQFTVVEFSGAITTDPKDVANSSGYAIAASSYSSGTASATTSTTAILTGVTHWYNQATTATAGTSGGCAWAIITEYGDPDLAADEHAIQYCTVATTGNYAANGTFSPTPDFSYTSLMAAFKTTAGGGGATHCTRSLLGVGCHD